MTFDKPEHKQLVLELMKATQIPFATARIAVEFMDAVEQADIKPPVQTKN